MTNRAGFKRKEINMRMGATTELYPLIEETYQKIKNGTDLNLLENKFRQEFTNIVSKEESKY